MSGLKKNKLYHEFIILLNTHINVCILQWQNFYIHLHLPWKGPFWSSWNGKLVFSLSFFFPKTSVSQLSLKSGSCPLSVIIDYMFRNNKVGVLGVNSLKKLSWCDQTFPLGSFPSALSGSEGEGVGLETASASEESWGCRGAGFVGWLTAGPAPAPAGQPLYLIKLQSQRSSWNTRFTSFWVF